MKLSIIVPCYNEEENVHLFYETVYNVFKNKKISYEIIFVNDGSKDATSNKLAQLVANKKQPTIKVVEFSRNFGKEAAMYAGLKQAQGELVSIIDADLQQDPNIILNMMDFLNKNKEYDSVAAFQQTRKEGKVLSFFKGLFYKIINSLTTIPFTQGASDFRVFKRPMIDAILQISEYDRFSKGIFSYVGFNTYFMPYEVNPRANGTSKWNFKKLFRYAIDGIEAFTTKPLKLAFYIAFACFFISIVLFISCFVKGFTDGIVILTVLLILFSINFLIIGIIGEYLSKTYMQVKNRPIYITKNIITNEKER